VSLLLSRARHVAYLQKILNSDSASHISGAGSSTAAFCIHHWYYVLVLVFGNDRTAKAKENRQEKNQKPAAAAAVSNFKFSSSTKSRNASLTKVFALQNTCKLAQGHHTVHTAPPYDLSLLLYTACGCLPTVEGCREEIF
jgi:hypothetical protein